MGGMLHMLYENSGTYNPQVFDVRDVEQAKRIILTEIPSGATTQERWQQETPLLVELLDRFALTEDDVVLDYGCGIGRMAKALIDRFSCKVIGIDISPTMLALATDYVDDSRFTAMTIEQCDELNLEFDAAIAVWVLQHCRTPEDDIAAIHRHLKSNGQLAVVNDAFVRYVPCVRYGSTGWFEDQVNIWILLNRYFDNQDEQPFPSQGKLAFYNKRMHQLSVPQKPALPAVDKRGWAGFARMGGVGDNLIAASVCKPLKELGFKVEVISQAPMACLFENNPFIDKLSVYEEKDFPKDMQAWHGLFAMRAKEYERFVNLSHTGEATHAFFPSMTQFWWPEKFRRKIAAGSYLETTHDLLDVPYTFGRLFWPTDEELEWAAELLRKIDKRPVIGWCLNGTRIDKVYPQAPMTIARLIKELDVAVVMIGRGPPSPDFTLAEQALSMVRAQNGSHDGLFHIGTAELKVRNALAFAQSCDLIIAPDTGPAWAVAMEPTPKIMLHSHASVENITKHWVNTVSLHADPQQVSCWPCHRLHNDISTCRPNEFDNGAACISSITPDRIVASARQLLGDQPCSKPKPSSLVWTTPTSSKPSNNLSMTAGSWSQGFGHK